jgi:hypothetical protein
VLGIYIKIFGDKWKDRKMEVEGFIMLEYKIKHATLGVWHLLV